MKKYLKIIPLALHPYLNLIWIVLWIFILNADTNSDVLTTALFVIFLGSFAAFYIYLAALGIASIVRAAKGKQSAYDSALMNLIVKSCQIPAYVINFVVGMLTSVSGHFGIIAGMFIFLADVITIAMSGFFAISCAIAFRKENLQSTGLSIITGIFSFTFCIDVAVAIYYFIKTSKTIKAGKNVINNYIRTDTKTNPEYQGDTQ